MSSTHPTATTLDGYIQERRRRLQSAVPTTATPSLPSPPPLSQCSSSTTLLSAPTPSDLNIRTATTGGGGGGGVITSGIVSSSLSSSSREPSLNPLRDSSGISSRIGSVTLHNEEEPPIAAAARGRNSSLLFQTEQTTVLPSADNNLHRRALDATSGGGGSVTLLRGATEHTTPLHGSLRRMTTPPPGDVEGVDDSATRGLMPSHSRRATAAAQSNNSRSSPPPPLVVPPTGHPSNVLGNGERTFRAYFLENPWETLNAQPALAVVGGTTALSMVSAYILQNHVLETHDHVGVFLFGSYLVFSSYFMVYYFLEQFSTSFRRISQDKKFYTISNLLKAGVLVSITPFAMHNLYRIILYDEWETNTLRNLGCIYAIPDFVSLIVVRRISWATRVHHVCVCLFNLVSLQNDYANENVCRLVVVYAAFSSFAYCVNMLLASRFLAVSLSLSRMLSYVALVVYVACCTVNWVWQVHYLRRLIAEQDHWTIYLYITMICFVMWDDIVLNRWLLQNARNSANAGGLLLASAAPYRF